MHVIARHGTLFFCLVGLVEVNLEFSMGKQGYSGIVGEEKDKGLWACRMRDAF